MTDKEKAEKRFTAEADGVTTKNKPNIDWKSVLSKYRGKRKNDDNGKNKDV